MNGERVGRYHIEDLIGQGGMGMVYKARDTRLDRTVALKFLPMYLSANKDSQARFIHEAKTASSLDHANICYIHEIDETDDGQLFMAMAYYSGETLKAKIDEGYLPLEDALDYAIQMARGLKRAHDADIIHRDIKPANVIVTDSDSASPRGIIKILDFGLAKVADIEMTRTNSTMGTIPYMSPEQTHGDHVDHRTDIWSLGAVLYEMLTGKQPFRGGFAEAIIYAILNQEPTPVNELRPDVPEELAQIVHRLLEKDPDKRFSNLDEVQEQLLPFLRTVPGGMQMLSQTRSAQDTSTASADPLADLPALPKEDLPGVPYRRLQRFTRKEAEIFFGRSQEIREVYNAITAEDREPIILLYGESGVGKSSLLEAGVLPRLEQEHAVHFLRRERKLGISIALARAFNTLGDSEAIKSAWHETEQRTDQPLTIIMDQVEEIYTRPMEETHPGDTENLHTPTELSTFLDVLSTVFSRRDERPAGRIVLSFRKEWLADFEKRLEEAALPYHRIYIERLSREGIIEVVHGPERSERLQQKYNMSIEAELGTTIASRLIGDPDSPIAPTLSILLAKMWELSYHRENRPVFSSDLYFRLLDKGILLDDFVEEQLSALQESNANAVSSGLVLDLLKYHTTDLGTAESRNLSDLEERYKHTGQPIKDIVDACQKEYFLITSEWIDDIGKTHPTSRLAHDTLAPLIHQRYKESDCPGQRAERALQSRKLDWQDGQKGAVLDEAGLLEVEQGKTGMRAWDEPEERLVKASRKAIRRRKTRQRVLYLTVLVLFIATGLVYRAWDQYRVCEGRDDADWCRACIDSGGQYNTEQPNQDVYCVAGNFAGLDITDDFILVQPGTFEMGSDSEYAIEEVQPVHPVTITRPFYLGKTEVTQSQWYAVMGNNPSSFKHPDRPVEMVSWEDVQTFLQQLNHQSGCANCYRLPTEAEWEYAARAGSTTEYSFGDAPDSLTYYGWYSENVTQDSQQESGIRPFSQSSGPFEKGSTQQVGQKRPNRWGFYDMHGNVYEMVQDWYGPYSGSPLSDPTGPESGSQKVIRGGSFLYNHGQARSAYRYFIGPSSYGNSYGFRVLRTSP